MKMNMRIVHRIMSGFLVSLGMALSACQTTEAGSVMAIEESGDQSRHLVKKIIGGVVMTVVRRPGNRNPVSLVIQETRVSSSGRPECLSPTGRILTVENVRTVFRKRPGHLRSAMVVMGDSLSERSDLTPGECVTVAPDDMDRAQTALRSSIEIAPSDPVARKEDHLGKGIVEMWARMSGFSRKVALGQKTQSTSVKRVLSSSRPLPPLSLAHPLHPA